MEEVDVAIIGAGAIGLAVARALSGGGKDIIVIEKNSSFGQEQSSRNSEVIHAGLYYPKGSIKSETCIRGRKLLYELCSKYNIPHKKLGKLIIASGKEETAKLNGIYKNAKECGIKDLRFLEKKDARKMEPDIEADSALFSPETGILDSHGLMEFFFQAAKEKGVNFAFSVEAIGIKKEASRYEITVREPRKDSFSFRAETVINSAGLFSDTVAGLAGIDCEKHRCKIHYCKGEYFRMKNPKKFSIRHPVYPPPGDTDLGIHVTPDLAGGLRLGPDATYVDNIDYDVDEKKRNVFFNSLSGFLPSLKEDDLIPDTAGVRAKLQGEGGGFRDFIIREENEKGLPNFVNLIGIESPGLTAAPAIAEKVKSCLNIR
jgi:L-2-hydroxyglutarate oxidase LhgO